MRTGRPGQTETANRGEKYALGVETRPFPKRSPASAERATLVIASGRQRVASRDSLFWTLPLNVKNARLSRLSVACIEAFEQTEAVRERFCFRWELGRHFSKSQEGTGLLFGRECVKA